MDKLNKPNQLIALKSNQKITVLQKKSYNILLKNAQNQIKFNEMKVSKDGAYNFEIDCNELHEMAGIKKKDLIYIEKEIEDLMGIIATVRDKDNNKNWTKFSLLPKIEKTDNKYKYMLIGDIAKALDEQSFFTTLNLLTMKSLSSQYSVIFYELAVRYKKYKIPKMTIQEIREITQTTNLYPRIFDLKKYVLDFACDEISEKTDIVLDYETIKNGRNISHINFKIEKKEHFETLEKTEEIEIIEEQKEYSGAVRELFKLLPEKEQIENRKNELEKLLKEHSVDYLKADIEYTKNKAKTDFWAYFLKSIKSGHFSSADLEKKKMAEEKNRLRAELEEIEKKEQEKLNEEKDKLVREKYKKMTKEDIEKYQKEFNKLAENIKKIAFQNSFEVFVISKIKMGE